MPDVYYRTCNEVVLYGFLFWADWRAALAIFALHTLWNIVHVK
jgi:hypothetical protein